MKKLLNNRVVNAIILVVNLGAALITVFSFFQNMLSSVSTAIFLTIFGVGILFAIAYFVSLITGSSIDKGSILTDEFHHVIDAYKEVTLELRDRFEDEESSVTFEQFRENEIRNLIIHYKELLKDIGIKRPKISLKLFHIDDNTLFTFCRGEANSSQSIRYGHGEHIIVDRCTGFNGIMNRNYKRYFVGNNLMKDYKDGKYHDFRGEPKYASSLVVPIRTYVGSSKGVPAYYDVIGFLCIDSKEKNQFLEEDPLTQMIIETTRAFADCLRRFTKGYYIKQLKMDCQPTEFTALSRHRAVFSWAGKGGIPINGA